MKTLQKLLNKCIMLGGKFSVNLLDAQEELNQAKKLLESKKCTKCPSTGETKLWCCNCCGKRIEEF